MIVDDNDVFVEAARGLLERQGMSIVGTAKTSDDAMTQARALRPDVVLVDVWLGNESGLDLVRRLCGERLNTDSVVILISTHGHDDVVELLPECSAAGFLSKAELSADAIERIAAGRAA
jgi:DNA-binding NarL/FixJ family response regulator